MDSQTIFQHIRDRFGEEGLEFKDEGPQPGIIVAPDRLVEFASRIRDDADLDFSVLTSLSGVDFPADEKLRVSCHVYSPKHHHLLAFHVDLPRQAPSIPTLSGVWPGAEWFEREAWDLLGIDFAGHPDLRRIMLPDDWQGHPLRKDFVEGDSYHGIPTRREREWLEWQK